MSNAAIKIEFGWGKTIEDSVNELLSFKKVGKSAYGEFNGVVLFSDTVTMDYAYKKITGKTKTEFDQAQLKRKEEYDKKAKEHENSIPEQTKFWMKKGREVLTEDKWEYWSEIVPYRLNDLYRGMELGNCLDIVEILNNGGSLSEAKQKIEDQGHSGMSFGLVCSMIREFSERGKEFVEYVR